MSSIPSFITNITSGIYGTSYEDDPIVQQFRYHLGLSPGQSIPNTPATEKDYIAFLSQRVTILQFIATLATQLGGSTVNVENEIAGFRSSLRLQASEAIPDNEASKKSFLEYITKGNNTLLFIAALTKDIYGSPTEVVLLLEAYRRSLGLVIDQPIPDTQEARTAFISYLATQTRTFGFISEFSKLVTGADCTEAQLAAFRSFLGLESEEPLPDEFITRTAYIDFLGLTHDFAPYAASVVKKAYGTSIIQNVPLLAEFRASLNLPSGSAIPTDDDTKRAFLYFSSSPTALAAQGFYGISQAAADSLAAFRATQSPPLASGKPLPADEATQEAYLAFLNNSGITQFIQETMMSVMGTALTNETLAEFRIYLRLKPSDAIPNDDTSKALFMSFLQEKLADVGKAASINAISPHEDAVRRVLFSAFSMVIEMLNTLQQTARVESKAIQLYAEWEKEYTNLVTATPIYGPTSENLIIANNADLGQTTLGQDNITIAAVTRWLYEQIQTKGGGSATFAVSSPAVSDPKYPDRVPGFPVFVMTKRSDGSYQLDMKCPFRDQWGGFYDNYNLLLSATVTPSEFLTGEDLARSVVDNLMEQYTTKWQNNQFSDSSFTLYAHIYSRDNKGALISEPPVFQTFPSNYLKTLWSGTPIKIDTYAGDSAQGNIHFTMSSKGMFEWGNSGQLVETSDSGALTMRDASGTTTFDAFSDIARYLLAKLAPTKGVASAEVETVNTFYCVMNTNKSVHFVYRLRRLSDGTYWWDFARRTYDDNGAVNYEYWPTTYDGISHRVGPIAVTSTDAGLGTGFWGPWNAPGAGAWPETVAYPSTFSKSSMMNIRGQSSSYIGEVNAQLQQYVQSTQAQKTNIDNAMKVMQNLMSQTLQATANQINLLEAIMQSLKSILTSIFH